MTFVVDTCCLCVELRTGSLIIAYLRLVSIILTYLLMIIDVKGACDGIGFPLPLDKTEAIYVIVSIAATLFISLIFDILLLVGLHQKRAKYVIYNVAFLIFVLVVTCIVMIYKIVINAPPLIIFKFTISPLLQLYFILVIRSHYVKMEKEDNGAILRKV